MMKYFTRKNIGWSLTIGLAILLTMSGLSKIFGSDEGLSTELGAGHILPWIKMIGIGELIALILFVIPRTMKFGTLLLSAYFGGAIVFHMAHPDPAYASFISPAGFLVFIWALSYVRGNEWI